jgi:hypothetical protein
LAGFISVRDHERRASAGTDWKVKIEEGEQTHSGEINLSMHDFHTQVALVDRVA